MSLVDILPKVISDSKKEYDRILAEDRPKAFTLKEIVINEEERNLKTENILGRGDNLYFMKFLKDEKKLEGKLNLIYIDPPFFTRTQYGADFKVQSDILKKIPAMKQRAYSDTWESGMEEYLIMLGVRLRFMKDLLSEDGSIFVHLDWHSVHYVKVLMDEIFGERNFINEIIWHYKSGGVSKRRFARKHDTILFYSKTEEYYFIPKKEKSYNRGYKPYRFKGVKEYRDETGWYTMVNRKDVWQLDMVGRTSAERTGYVTQKPETLIQRMLESCTREGDLCADFFGGSGTMAAAANKMGRKWISCDIGRLATINSHKRLIGVEASYSLYEEQEESSIADKGELKADIALKPDLIFDKMRLRVELTGYRPHSLKDLPVQEKYLSTIEEIINEDPLQLIAYWSIDFDYKDGVNCPDVYLCRDAGGIDTVYEGIGHFFGPILIKAVDIFGNSAVLEADLEQESDLENGKNERISD